MKRLLITGATGFIGSAVTRRARASGYEVVALCPPGESAWRLGEQAERVRWILGDLFDPDGYRRAIVDVSPQACVHLAWTLEPGQIRRDPRNLRCLSASLRLLEILIEAGCTQVAVSGSCEEYAPSSELIGEDHPPQGSTLYSASKLALKTAGTALATQHGVKLAWGRIFLVYGPSEDPRRVVPGAIRALLRDEPFLTTDGRQIRDYLHVDDVAAGLLTLIENDYDGVCNICSMQPLSLRDLLSHIGKQLNREHLLRFGAIPMRPWDPPFLAGRNDRLRELGWSPRYSMQDGLQQTIDWWRASPGHRQQVAPAREPSAAAAGTITR